MSAGARRSSIRYTLTPAGERALGCPTGPTVKPRLRSGWAVTAAGLAALDAAPPKEPR